MIRVGGPLCSSLCSGTRPVETGPFAVTSAPSSLPDGATTTAPTTTEPSGEATAETPPHPLGNNESGGGARVWVAAGALTAAAVAVGLFALRRLRRRASFDRSGQRFSVEDGVE